MAPQKKPLHKTTDMSIKPLGLKATARGVSYEVQHAHAGPRKAAQGARLDLGVSPTH